MKRAICLAALLGVGSVAAPAMGGGVEWIDWTVGTNDYPSSVVVGQFGGPFTGIGATYTGGAENYQTNGGNYYWTPLSTYTNFAVSNAPGSTDDIELSHWNVTHTVTFTQPVTNPFMAISSLGSPTTFTTWTFNAPFAILSSGAGYFGTGPLVQGPNNSLIGAEGNGVLEFQGTFTSISWTVLHGENFAAFTVGIIPAPGAASLLGLGALAATRRRR